MLFTQKPESDWKYWNIYSEFPSTSYPQSYFHTQLSSHWKKKKPWAETLNPEFWCKNFKWRVVTGVVMLTLSSGLVWKYSLHLPNLTFQFPINYKMLYFTCHATCRLNQPLWEFNVAFIYLFRDNLAKENFLYVTLHLHLPS